MARLLKKGLDFFHFDTSFYEDIKIRKLIRYHHAQAVVVYQLILIRIYNEGYYLKWDDDLPFIVAEVSHLEDDYVKAVINFCLDIGLFDKHLFDEHKVLTSRGIQNRFFDFCVVAKRKIATENPYLLIDLSSKAVKISTKSINSEKTTINSEEILFNSEEMYINNGEMFINSETGTQSKVKESKDNNSLRSSLSQSSSTTTARVGGEGKPEDVVDGCISARDGVCFLKEDREWLLQMQRKFRKEQNEIIKWLDSFVVDCDCRGKQQHKDLSDVKQHVNDWLTKIFSGNGSGKGKKGSQKRALIPIQEHWVQCKAELCKAVSADVSKKSFDQVDFVSFDEINHKLHIQVPTKDTYQYMEDNLVDVMNAHMPKYFGNFQLVYHVNS